MEGKSFLDGLFGLREDLQNYLETKVSYYGLTAFEKAVRLLIVLLGNGIIVVTLLVAVFFLAGAGALYLGSLLESHTLGFLITGGFFLLVALLLMLFRKRIFGPCIIRSLANIFFTDDHENQ